MTEYLLVGNISTPSNVVALVNQETFVVENDTEIMTEPEERVENVSDLASIRIDNENVQKTGFDGNKNNSKKPERKCEICEMSLSSKCILKQHINSETFPV